MEQIERVFRPEFLNRLDDVIVFRHLTAEDLKQVVDLELAKVRERLAERGLTAGADRRGQRVPHQEGLEHRLRCSSAAPGDRELRRRSARPRNCSRASSKGKDTIVVDASRTTRTNRGGSTSRERSAMRRQQPNQLRPALLRGRASSAGSKCAACLCGVNQKFTPLGIAGNDARRPGFLPLSG